MTSFIFAVAQEVAYNEQLGPSGFWTSNHPAVGGAYRWRLLGIGIALALGMGLVVMRMIRKANAARAASVVTSDR